jgi:hypothetical protein
LGLVIFLPCRKSLSNLFLNYLEKEKSQDIPTII